MQLKGAVKLREIRLTIPTMTSGDESVDPLYWQSTVSLLNLDSGGQEKECKNMQKGGRLHYRTNTARYECDSDFSADAIRVHSDTSVVKLCGLELYEAGEKEVARG